MKKYNQILKTILIFFFLLTVSCAQTVRLSNGTKVLSKKFSNIKNFNSETLKDIDTDYFYVKVDDYFADINFNKLREAGSDVPRKLQFYKNGRIRFFSLGMEDPNPLNAGKRGIIYNKNGLKIDFTNADQDGQLFRGTYKVNVINDKIYLLELPTTFLFKPSEYFCYEYKKSDKIPENWKKFSADW